MIIEVVKILVEEEHSSFSMQFKSCWIVVRVGSKMCFWLPGEFGIPEVVLLGASTTPLQEWLLRVARIVRSRLWRGRKPMIIYVGRVPA
jgi:hypothetical protein